MWVPVGNKVRGSVTLKLHFLALEIDKSINLIEEKALEMQGDERSPWISACSCEQQLFNSFTVVSCQRFEADYRSALPPEERTVLWRAAYGGR